MQSTDPQAENRLCSGWADIVEALEEFRPPKVTSGDLGVVFSDRWVFRGLKRACYELEPAIEREAQSKSVGWAGLEHIALDGFKSRATIHLSALSVPQDELSWLAMMQHYAVPTRLLDFTYSPFVALYFAVSPEKEGKCSGPGAGKQRIRKSPGNKCAVRVWAIDAGAVKSRFQAVARRTLGIPGRVGTADLSTDRDSMIFEIDEFRKRTLALLSHPRVQKGASAERVRLPGLTTRLQPAVREPAGSVFV